MSSRSSSISRETLAPLPIESNRPALLRYLGYRRATPIAPKIPDVIERALAVGQTRLEPRATYAVFKLHQRDSMRLHLGDTVIQGKVATFLARADRIVAFVATVGAGISEAASAAAAAGDLLTSWALDALGSWATEATANALTHHIRSQLQELETLSPRYSPGYCGMDMTQQRVMFNLSHAEGIGVALLPSLLMQPLKSVSGLYGIGSEDAFGADATPCERCNETRCTMRR